MPLLASLTASFLLLIYADFVNKCGAKIANEDCHVLYVYTVNKLKCGTNKFPHYLRDTLKQALMTQSHCKVALLANVGECPQIKQDLLDKLGSIGEGEERDHNNKRLFSLINMNDIPQSQMTKDFLSLAPKVLSHEEDGLWVLAATRFFHIYDWMTTANATNVFHIEGDTLLYRDFAPSLSLIKQSFPTMAVTPLYINLAFFTAAVLWISNVNHLSPFITFLVDLVRNRNNEKAAYNQWLVDRFPHKKNAGDRIPNEMSMLAYFHSRYPNMLKLFPVLPGNATYHCQSMLGPLRCLYEQQQQSSDNSGGNSVVSWDDNLGVFDGSSWAQYLGGTHAYPGTHIHFKEEVAIVGNALNHDHCEVKFVCLTKAMMDRSFPLGNNHHIHQHFPHEKDLLQNHTSAAATVATSPIGGATPMERKTEKAELMTTTTKKQCITAPVVKCNTSSSAEWSLLWNLHMQSKTTHLFRSRPCNCSSHIE